VHGSGPVAALLAFETARQLGVRAILPDVAGDGAWRGVDDGPPERRRVLIVDDVLTTRAGIRSLIAAVEAAGAEIVECAVVVDRSGGTPTLTSPVSGRVYPLHALWAPREADSPA
jgi:orotate phosphoribosyltransferase